MDNKENERTLNTPPAVINFSNVKFSNNQIKLLSKGCKYSLNNTIENIDFYLSISDLIRKIKLNIFFSENDTNDLDNSLIKPKIKF